MKLIITEPTDFSTNAIKSLSNKFEIIKLDDISELEKYIHIAEVVFIRLGIIFDEFILKKANKLKFICTPTTGLDHINLEYCKKNNIKVISLKDERVFLDSIPSTAEHAWTLLMAINRKLYQANENVYSKKWDRNAFKSFNLKDKTLGLLGLGRVGNQMVKYARAFGMKIIGYDTNCNIKISKVKNVSSAIQLFKESDFLSIHIPLNDNNIEFVSKDLINILKPDACIINTSRGKVWDEKAISKALTDGKIRGVATDVIYKELSKDWQDSPLLNVDSKKFNCIITPHIAGATFDSMQMTEEFVANKLISYVG